MPDVAETLEIRVIPAASADHHPALHRVFSVHPPAPRGAPSPQVSSILANVSRGAVSIDLLIGAFRENRLVSACMAAESPGGAAMVFIPNDLEDGATFRATVAALRELQERAWRRPISLLESLLEPGAKTQSRALRDAGFRFLTSLLYLRRDKAPSMGSVAPAADLSWVPYSPEHEALFADALECSYVGSHDCPELTALRSTADVLVGHRATGVFDPTIWWVALRGDEPVGVLLLNHIPSEPSLEVDYVGVSHTARGTGVADALMQRAVRASNEHSAKALALAVDQRNRPARRMYARWGFRETGVRDAWIASFLPTRA